MSTRPPRNCPICGQPAVAPQDRPFCSPGCRDRDLIAWANEDYRAPVKAADEQEAEEAAEALDRPAAPDL
jgi:endogenous inhibitor of DNA gyrase (YacG/DUF329 family)